MIDLEKKWSVQIDINNVCSHNCIYCVKHIRHLRKDQLFQITLDELERAIDSLEGYEGKISLTGGDPLNHPQFEDICEMVSRKVPKHKAIIFTSHKAKLRAYKPLIDRVFGEVYVNFHDEGQRNVCLHQPMLLAVGDMVKDRDMRDTLISNCWCNEMWSPVINRDRAFFCDCAAGLDMALGMNGGWPVESGWLKRSYQDQVQTYCHLCGMCLPYPGQRLCDGEEKISIGLFQRFVECGLRNLSGMNVITEPLTGGQVLENLNGWSPWSNRQDRCPEGGGEGPEYVNQC